MTRKDELLQKSNKQLTTMATNSIGKLKVMSYDVAIISTIILDKERYEDKKECPSIRCFAKTIGYSYSTISLMKKAYESLEEYDGISIVDDNRHLFDYNKINFIFSNWNILHDLDLETMLKDYTKSDIEDIIKNINSNSNDNDNNDNDDNDDDDNDDNDNNDNDDNDNNDNDNNDNDDNDEVNEIHVIDDNGNEYMVDIKYLKPIK